MKDRELWYRRLTETTLSVSINATIPDESVRFVNQLVADLRASLHDQPVEEQPGDEPRIDYSHIDARLRAKRAPLSVKMSIICRAKLDEVATGLEAKGYREEFPLMFRVHRQHAVGE